MKKTLTLLFTVLISVSYSYGQEKTTENVIHSESPTKTREDNKIYTSKEVEVRAEFKEGTEKMNQFLRDNFAIPKEITDQNLKGEIISTFVVEKDGTLTDIKISKDQGYNTNNEMVRVLKLMPKWYPAELNGKKVRVLFTLSYRANGGN
jgi:protein TonB